MLANKTIEELDRMAAFENQKPIRSKEDMPKMIVTEKMDSDWKERITENAFWSVGYKGELPLDFLPLTPLREKLLTFAGEEVCMPFPEPDLAKIMERGQLWYGENAILIEGIPSGCHTNSSVAWSAAPEKLLLATGYALSDDGMWRQHSWCVLVKGNNDGIEIIETTELRTAYFGFVMNDVESKSFYMSHVGTVDAL